MNDNDALFNKWNGWLETIKKDTINLFINRHIFWEVQKIIEANPKIHLPSTFYRWMGSMYAVYMSIGLRRQADKDSRAISFYRLLKEIESQAGVVSRERYIALCQDKGLRTEVADREFDRLAGIGRPHIDPSMVNEDRAQLIEQTKDMKNYVDKRVAHYDRQRPTSLPTYADVDECLNFVETLLIKYLAVLRAESYQTIDPVWQYDWKEIFRHAWIPSESGG